MMEFKIIEDHIPELWEGKMNILVRMWTYTKIGLNQANDYKYVIAAIFGLYYTFKLTNPLWLALMFVVITPLLILLGRWWLYRGAKPSEYVSTRRGTMLGYNQYNTQVRIIQLLEEINKKLHG